MLKAILNDRRRALPIFPNSVWATIADIPLTAHVLNNGSVYKKEGDELIGVSSYLYSGSEQVLTDSGEPILVNFGYEVFTTKDEEIFTWL